jgi:glyoxylase-like metal-dependent hydrolase (beta-lactamase superfamily II)
MRITEPVCGVYKLEVPFEAITTAVFAVTLEEGYLLIDCATTADDVDGHILPALREIGFTAPPRALLLTHPHGDHMGGAPRLLELFPEMEIYSAAPPKALPYLEIGDGTLLFDRIQAVLLPGHTDRSVGFLHLPTATLISGDCLQQRGVDKYTNGIRFPALYLQSIARLRSMPLRCILASHDYVPLGSTARGSAEITAYLTECEQDTPKDL